MGTIRYAAPEYLFGQPYDTRADIFSFGAVMFELVTGKEFAAECQQWADLTVSRFNERYFDWGKLPRARITNSLSPYGM